MEEGWYQKTLAAQKRGKYLEAREYLIKGADSEDVKCMTYLGWCYIQGILIECDTLEAKKWLRIAGDAGDATAMIWLSESLLGIGAEYEQCDLIAKVLESDDDYARGYLYFRCYNEKERGVDFLKRSAENGNMFAQELLGFAYWYGSGVTVDNKKALEWFQKSADQGFSRGQYGLGRIYSTGIGADQNYSEAMYWFYLAMKQGNESARSYYKSLCKNGYNVEWSVRNHEIFPDRFKKQQFTFLLCLRRNGIILPTDLRKMIIYKIARNRLLLPSIQYSKKVKRNTKKIKLSK